MQSTLNTWLHSAPILRTCRNLLLSIAVMELKGSSTNPILLLWVNTVRWEAILRGWLYKICWYRSQHHPHITTIAAPKDNGIDVLLYTRNRNPCELCLNPSESIVGFILSASSSSSTSSWWKGVQCSPSALLGDEFRLYFTRDLRLPDYFPLSTTTAKETRHPVSGAVGCQYTDWHVCRGEEAGMWFGCVWN